MDGRRPSTEANQHVALDINTAWLESVDDRARLYLNKKPPANPTIFRVPPCMRHGNPHAYKPKLVSIGPYHRGTSKDFNATEELKWRLLHDYLSKIPDGSKNEGLRKMKDLEKPARQCYSEAIDLDSDQFVEMLLLDGCFLVQIFIISMVDMDLETEEHKSLRAVELKSLLDNNLWFSGIVFLDLLLLENQLPYFVVEHLLDTLRMPAWNSYHFQRAVISDFAEFLPNYFDVPQPVLPTPQGFQDLDHLLHLFHLWILGVTKSQPQEVNSTRSCYKLSLELFYSLLSPIIDKTRDCLSMQRRSNSSHSNKFLCVLPCVTELVEAGVKIKEKKTESFLDISFSKGVLKIPPIVVDENANFVLANLIALEQCCNRHGPYVTLYISFLDQIIDTPRDAELLHQEGIIHRALGNDVDIASLFNKLGADIGFSGHSYLKDVYKDLKAYCHSSWPRWRAKAVRDYFSNPWAIISLGAGVVLLGLAILQTLYAILAYYKM